MGLLRECYRRLQHARHAPAHWRSRPDTIDRRIFRHVAIDNEYRLPDRFSQRDTILDVGAHIGSFALACLRRGAGRVVCCEPDPDNFDLLTHNLAPFSDRVTLVYAAAWPDADALLKLHNPRDARNTGAPRVGTVGTPVPAVAFDELVSDLDRVRLCKLDCEGAEWPILLAAEALDEIDELCGEYHLGDFPAAYHVPPHTNFTPELLRNTLAAHGFGVELADAPGSDLPVGLFFARR